MNEPAKEHKCFLCGVTPVEKQDYVCLACSLDSIQALWGIMPMRVKREVRPS